jgi:glutathione S-transferase
MKLYHSKHTRSLRVLWMLEEMGVDYELEVVPFPATQNPQVLALNPFGTIPVFVDGDVVLTESSAILEYLGRRHGPTPLVPDVSSPSYPLYLDYLHFGEGSLAAPMSHLVRTRRLAPEDQKNNWTVGKIAEVFLTKVKGFAMALETRDYAAGDAFTAADIAVAYAINFGVILKVDAEYPTNIYDYLVRVQSREAYKRATAI